MQRVITTNSVLLDPELILIYKIVPPLHKKLKTNWFDEYSFEEPCNEDEITQLLNQGYLLEFETIQSKTFFLNIQLLDSELPKIISALVLYTHIYNASKTADLLEIIERENPINYNLEHGHMFYKEKVSRLLYNLSVGMNSKELWDGNYNANIEFVIARANSKSVYYNAYNKCLFLDYLIDNTKLEHLFKRDDPKQYDYHEAKNFKYGWLYEENGLYYLKLNLQIRFA